MKVKYYAWILFHKKVIIPDSTSLFGIHKLLKNRLTFLSWIFSLSLTVFSYIFLPLTFFWFSLCQSDSLIIYFDERLYPSLSSSHCNFFSIRVFSILFHWPALIMWRTHERSGTSTLFPVNRDLLRARYFRAVSAYAKLGAWICVALYLLMAHIQIDGLRMKEKGDK